MPTGNTNAGEVGTPCSAARFFDPVSLPEQDFDYAVTEIALNDDLALFRRTAHTAFAFEQASQLFQVVVAADETFNQSHLFACPLLAALGALIIFAGGMHSPFFLLSAALCALAPAMAFFWYKRRKK